MARSSRLRIAGVPQHVIQRGNNRQATFFADEDYFFYRRSGTLWEGRFKASLVDTETHFLRCCHYIECNPVRARIVAHPGHYRWSSYRFHTDGMPDKLLTIHDQYERLGRTPDERQQAYRALSRGELNRSELCEIRDSVNRGWPLGS